MLSWSAKWLGKKKIYYRDCFADDFLTKIYEMLEEADAVITWNGISFDMKHLNREFIEAEMDPPFLPQNIDLVRVVRKHFRAPSNKLDYWAGRLLGEKKIKVEYQLWLDCMNGIQRAWNTMKKYNKEDTALTERMYLKLRPWITNHPNHGLFVADQDDPVCRNCGSSKVWFKGNEARTMVRSYARYKCVDCGANLRGRFMVKGGKKSPQVIK